jgi:proteasome assembly chaperone (PAC2) family protein
MNDLLDLWEKPAGGRYIIAGWRQWADAGDISSGLPQYLIDETGAAKIGEAKPDGFYLFQIPGTHHLLRPVVKLVDGHRESLERRHNEFFYAGDAEKGFFVFLGDEPHQNERLYAEVFLDAVQELGVKRVAVLGGVHGPVPYDRSREISCVYSLPGMKNELERYAVKLSDYEGGATIGVYLADRAEERDVELVAFYGFAPAYDFSKDSMLIQRVAIDRDYKAWHDLMVRLNHMFELELDLSDLERRSEELISAWHSKIEQLARMPQLGVRDYLKKINEDFTDRTFEPLSQVWEEALGDILEDS